MTKVTGISASPWVLGSLANGTLYYEYITAVDSNSNESTCSGGASATTTSPLSCNGTSYSNAETCTYYNAVTNAGGTVANLAMYDAYVTAVKALTTSGCNGTFPGCAGIAYDANFGYHTTAANVDTAYDGADPTGATTATQGTAGNRPPIVTNAINANCTAYHTPYNVAGCVCSGVGPGSC